MENRDTNAGAMTRQPQAGLSRPASRYNPLYEMQEQMRRMDAMFNRIFGFEPFPVSIRNEFQQLQRMQESEPDVDIYESDTEYILHAALPGIDPQDIQLEATEDSVVLAAQRRSPFDQQQTTGNNNGQQGVRNVGGQSGAQATTGQTAGTQTASGQSTRTQAGQPAGQTHIEAGQHAGMGTPNSAGSNTGTTGDATGNQNTDTPHTQHRQSRYAAQSRFRLVYTLPTPIDPEAVRANFRHGMLELHLPKQRPPSSRTVPITIEATGAGARAIGAQAGQQTSGSGQSTGGIHEGNPASKMGSSYTPSAGEDHTAQAQSIGARADHEPGRQDSPIASGQTNPMGTGSTPSPGTPADAKRS